MKNGIDRKRVSLWFLYDFANSIVFIAFLLYFAQWLVIDGGLSDLWFNVLFIISTILLIFSAPVLAAYVDQFGHRKLILNICTIGTAVFYALSALLAFQGKSYIVLIAICFVLSQYFYQLSFVFYNAMIEGLALPERRGIVSGLGQVANYAGQICGLLILMPLSASRLDPLLPAVGMFVILALPMMIWFRDSQGSRPFEANALRTEVKTFLSKGKAFFKYSPAAIVLIAFFFFNDAMVTATNNFSIFIERVYGAPDSAKSLVLILVLVTAGIGSYISGKVADKYGLRKSLEILLILWAIIVFCMAFAPTFIVYAVLVVLLGFLLGSTWTVSRAYMSVILSPEELNYGFSFYTLAERFATLVGPLAWGIIVSGIGDGSPIYYKIAVVVMSIFILIGYFILRKGNSVEKN